MVWKDSSLAIYHPRAVKGHMMPTLLFSGGRAGEKGSERASEREKREWGKWGGGGGEKGREGGR